MKVLEVVGSDDRVCVDVDPELLQEEVDVCVELWLPSLAQADQDLASVLDKVLEDGRVGELRVET